MSGGDIMQDMSMLETIGPSTPAETLERQRTQASRYLHMHANDLHEMVMGELFREEDNQA